MPLIAFLVPAIQADFQIVRANELQAIKVRVDTIMDALVFHPLANALEILGDRRLPAPGEDEPQHTQL